MSNEQHSDLTICPTELTYRLLRFQLYLSVPGLRLPGEEGGEGNGVHCSRGREALGGAHVEEGKGLFPSITEPRARPEGSFKSSGSSSESMTAAFG